MITANPTIAGLKKWAAANRPLAEAVLAATVLAEVEAERVAKYAEPIFATFTFLDCDTGEKITKIDQLYNCEDDELCAKFYAELDAAHRAHGFEGDDGFCPALIAEGLKRTAERELILSLGAFCGAGSLSLTASAGWATWGSPTCAS